MILGFMIVLIVLGFVFMILMANDWENEMVHMILMSVSWLLALIVFIFRVFSWIYKSSENRGCA